MVCSMYNIHCTIYRDDRDVSDTSRLEFSYNYGHGIYYDAHSNSINL
jgi:hypothetical protein